MLFSIIVPVKEINDYIRTAIPHYLNMDFDDYELIIILEEASTTAMVMAQLDEPFLSRKKADAYLSYGPYRVLSSDQTSLMLEPNPNWCCAPDPRGYDRILCLKIGT